MSERYHQGEAGGAPPGGGDNASAESPEERTANSDYTVVDRAPLVLDEGTEVTTGTEDRAWKGWVWVIAPDHRGTYVPQDYLEPLDGPRARMVRQFAANDLSVKRGEPVWRIRHVNGWFWCRNSEGAEGWLPDYLFNDPLPVPS